MGLSRSNGAGARLGTDDSGSWTITACLRCDCRRSDDPGAAAAFLTSGGSNVAGTHQSLSGGEPPGAAPAFDREQDVGFVSFGNRSQPVINGGDNGGIEAISERA